MCSARSRRLSVLPIDAACHRAVSSLLRRINELSPTAILRLSSERIRRLSSIRHDRFSPCAKMSSTFGHRDSHSLHSRTITIGLPVVDVHDGGGVKLSSLAYSAVIPRDLRLFQ
jgi:hypothetical protein